jgi:sulfur relay (sulfurtransferase) complex TusBCD TusD component (DsrE family)
MLIMNDSVASIAAAREKLHKLHQGGATLDTVFMYHNAAYAPLNFAASELAAWQTLADQSGGRLLICRTQLERVQGAAPPPFEAGGLADWVQASLRSDRRLCVPW